MGEFRIALRESNPDSARFKQLAYEHLTLEAKLLKVFEKVFASLMTQIEVQQHNVDIARFEDARRFCARAAMAHHRESRLGPKQPDKALAEQNVSSRIRIRTWLAAVLQTATQQIRKGIAGILMKHNSPALLVQGIRDAMKGKIWFEQDLLRRSLAVVDADSSAPTHSRFTNREKAVLSFVFEGLSNEEIADQIEVSESAIKSCLQHLFAKAGIRTRSQLVRVALEQYRDEL